MGLFDFVKKTPGGMAMGAGEGNFNERMGDIKGGLGAASDLYNKFKTGPQIDTKDVDYDQGTKDLLAQAEAESNKTPEQMAAEAMKGSEAGKSLLAMDSEEGLGGPSMDASLKALGKRQERQWADSSNRLKGKEETQAMKTKGALMQQVAQQKAHQDAMRQQNWARRQQVETFKKQARSQAISSIMGGVGAVGGAALGTAIAPGVGTAMGASIGGSLGGAAGGAA